MGVRNINDFFFFFGLQACWGFDLLGCGNFGGAQILYNWNHEDVLCQFKCRKCPRP